MIGILEREGTSKLFSQEAALILLILHVYTASEASQHTPIEAFFCFGSSKSTNSTHKGIVVPIFRSRIKE
jgi:hypothetical protein